MGEPVALGDILRPLDRSANSIAKATGFHAQWYSDGGGDGYVSWHFAASAHGYVICHACAIGTTVTPGQRSLPSPYRRCEHMMRARI